MKAKEQADRIAYAVSELEKLGIKITNQSMTEIRFMHKGCQVIFFPYKGWYSGKTVIDGRGIKNLLKQLKPEQK